jgi:hypothetical protein
MRKEKRTESITVRLSHADLALFHRAGKKRYGDAPLTKSTLLLSLARIGARSVLDKTD